jgi:flavin reductase (DIM6/NTAB) family NADH-FMN oxidoreductase RutF
VVAPSDDQGLADVRHELRGVAGQLASGVAVLVAMAAGEPHAVTAGSVLVVSAEPPLLAVFFATGGRTHRHLLAGGRFSVSLLRRADHGLARRFARPNRPEGWAGLAGVPLVRRDPDPPILAHANAWLDCRVDRNLPIGDHTCFVADVLAAGRDPEAEPLIYYRGRFHGLGGPVAPAPWAPLERSDLTADW